MKKLLKRFALLLLCLLAALCACTPLPEPPAPLLTPKPTEELITPTPAPEATEMVETEPREEMSEAPTTAEPTPEATEELPPPTPELTEAPAHEYGTLSQKSITIPSRGVEVPATVCVPASSNGSVPLVVLSHGFRGSRDVNGGFTALSGALLDAGVASIRVDFAGCGQSAEDFSACSLTTMTQDVLAAVDYMLANYNIDPSRIGLLGYSLGGRVSLELVADGRLAPHAMLLIAPAASTADFKKLLGGESAWASLRQKAEQNGYAELGVVRLGLRFFEDMDRRESPAAAAASNFGGRAGVVYSTNDGAVSPSVSKGVADALGCEPLVFSTGGHAYGLQSDPTHPLLSQIIALAVSLFAG